MSYVFRTLIVPRNKALLAREIAYALAGDAAGNMWTVGLSDTGQNPATHFISTGAVGEEFVDCLVDANILFSICQTVNYDISLRELEDLLAACDISEEPPFDAIFRLGLHLITDVAE